MRRNPVLVVPTPTFSNDSNSCALTTESGDVDVALNLQAESQRGK